MRDTKIKKIILMISFGIMAGGVLFSHFAFADWTKTTAGEVESPPSMADIDGDGMLELVVGCGYAGTGGIVYAWKSDGTDVPGWEGGKATGNSITSSPAIEDLDPAYPGLEIVVTSHDRKVYAWHADGTDVFGWPIETGWGIHASPVIANLDNNWGNGLEIIVASHDFNVYAWHSDGTPLSGWPIYVGGWGLATTPAVADIDGNPSNGLEVVVATTNEGRVYAWHSDGTLVSGWPKVGNSDESCDISPAVADIDPAYPGLEIIAERSNGLTHRIFAWHSDGTDVSGWPKTMPGRVDSSPAIDDLDGDGDLEIVVGCRNSYVYAWHHNGTDVTGWPKGPLGSEFWGIVSSPAIADLDGNLDSSLEVVIGGSDFNVYAFHADGSTVSGWPKATGSGIWSSPAVADMDGNGTAEVAIGSFDYKVYVWSLQYQTGGEFFWPTFRQNTNRTGSYYENEPETYTIAGMVDNYNDGNPNENTIGLWTGWGSSGTSTVEEVLLHKYDGWKVNNAKKITYDCSGTDDYCWYASLLSDGVRFLGISNFSHLSFRIKGEQGNEDFYIQLQYGIGEGPEPLAEIHSSDHFAVTGEWQQVNIPLSAFTDIDKTRMRAIAMVFRNDMTLKYSTVYIDNLQFSHGYGKPESTGPVRIDRESKALFVNDELFVIKGVGYQPVPIGTYPPHPDNSAIYDRDFPLLVYMGCNTIKTWNTPGPKLMSEAQEYGLKVIANFWMAYDVDFSDPAVRYSIKQDFAIFVNNLKNSPALLMWSLGNENNYQNGSNPEYYSLCNELGEIAYGLEGSAYHPIMIVNGNLFNIGVDEKAAEDMQLNYLDAWGCNVYLEHFYEINWEGDMRDFFDVYREKTSKPLVITEYGADAYYTIDRWTLEGYEDEEMQADWVEVNTLEIMDEQNTCLGSCVMEYSDEWWKYWDGSPSVHDRGGFYSGDWGNISPDDFMNEEYWGMVQIAADGTWGAPDGIDDIKKRLVYYSLRDIFTGEPDNTAPGITNISPRDGLVTGNRRVPFHADVSDNICLWQAILLLDGQEVLNEFLEGQTAAIDFTPSQDLSLGPHTYKLSVWDTSDNVTTVTRNFRVLGVAPCYILPGPPPAPHP